MCNKSECYLGERCGRKIFPFGAENSNAIEVVGRLEGNHDQTSRVYGVGGLAPTLSTMQGRGTEPKVLVVGNTNPSGNGMNGKVFDSKGLAPTLTTNKGEGNKILVEPRAVLTPDREEKRQNGRRFKEPGEPMFTLTAQDKHAVAILRQTRTEYGKQMRKQYEAGELDEGRQSMISLEPRTDGIANTLTTVQKDNLLLTGYRIRKLTPKECFRLQSFPDEWYYKLKEHGISDSQLYKMAGNAVTSVVAYEIGRRLMDGLETSNTTPTTLNQQ